MNKNSYKIIFLILMLMIQTGIEPYSVYERKQPSFIKYSSISSEKETEICIDICIECFYDEENTNKVNIFWTFYYKTFKYILYI